MAARLGNIGLMAGWENGDEPWGDEMNENLRTLDALVQAVALTITRGTPPTDPAPVKGDMHICNTQAEQAWAGHSRHLAVYNGTNWEFIVPKAGWVVRVLEDSMTYFFNGTLWATLLPDNVRALGAITGAGADRGVYFTGPSTMAMFPLTAPGRALVGATTAALQRTALGLGSSATLNIDADVTMTADSDTLLPTQRATKAYIDNKITGGAAGVMLFKGVLDCSTNPNYPTGYLGNLYKISVAGKIGGATGPNVEVGDTVYCITDSVTGDHATVGGNWSIVQANIDGAVTGPASNNANDIVTFVGSSGKTLKGQTLSSLIDSILGGLNKIGGIYHRGATQWTTLPAGDNGFVLTSNGPDQVPSYKAIPASITTPTSVVDGTLAVFDGEFGKTFKSRTINQILDAAFGNSPGGLLVRGVSSWAALLPGATGQVLTSNGESELPTFQTPNTGTDNTGDVVGPEGAPDHALVVFDGVTGKKIKALPFGSAGQVLASTGDDLVFTDPSTGSGDITGPTESTDSNLALFSGTDGKTLKESPLSDYLDTVFSSTVGGVLVRGAAKWISVGPGLANTVLTSNGPGSDPAFKPAPGSAEDIFDPTNVDEAINEAAPYEMPAASTMNIADIPANTVRVTGGTMIDHFSEGRAGAKRLLRFTNYAYLSSAGNIKALPGGGISVQPGDNAEFIAIGTDWELVSYSRASGESVVAPTQVAFSSRFEPSFDNNGEANWADPSLFRSTLLTVKPTVDSTAKIDTSVLNKGDYCWLTVEPVVNPVAGHRYWRMEDWSSTDSSIQVNQLNLCFGGAPVDDSLAYIETPNGEDTEALKDGSSAYVFDFDGLYVRWEFDEPVTVDGFQYNFYASSGNYPDSVNLYYSDDGGNWMYAGVASSLTVQNYALLPAPFNLSPGVNDVPVQRTLTLDVSEYGGNLVWLDENGDPTFAQTKTLSPGVMYLVRVSEKNDNNDSATLVLHPFSFSSGVVGSGGGETGGGGSTSGGDVVGPASASDGQIVIFDGTTGKKIKGLSSGSVGQVLTNTGAGLAFADLPEAPPAGGGSGTAGAFSSITTRGSASSSVLTASDFDSRLIYVTDFKNFTVASDVVVGSYLFLQSEIFATIQAAEIKLPYGSGGTNTTTYFTLATYALYLVRVVSNVGGSVKLSMVPFGSIPASAPATSGYAKASDWGASTVTFNVGAYEFYSFILDVPEFTVSVAFSYGGRQTTTIVITQDETGGRTFTLNPAIIVKSGTVDTTPKSKTRLYLECVPEWNFTTNALVSAVYATFTPG